MQNRKVTPFFLSWIDYLSKGGKVTKPNSQIRLDTINESVNEWTMMQLETFSLLTILSTKNI